MGVISTKSAEHYTWGQFCDGWHLATTATLSVIQERVPFACGETRHYHEKAEQFFYVLAGTATLEVAGTSHTVNAQEGVHVAARIPHSLRNEQRDDLLFLVISTPPSHGDRITVGENDEHSE